MIHIHENLRNLRVKERYSLEDVAEIIGVSRQSVAKWESGDTLPDIEKCMKLAKLYKVTLDELVSNVIDIMEDDEERGKYCFGFSKIKDGMITLPEKAKAVFHLHDGDLMILLGDERKGIAMVKVTGIEEDEA